MIKDSFWCCDNCKKVLAEIIDEQNIVILGLDNRSYQTHFANIDVICTQCGGNNHIESKTINFLLDSLKTESERDEEFQGIQDFTQAKPQNNNYKRYLLSGPVRNKLLSGLSEKQKKIFRILENPKVSGEIGDISSELGVSREIIKKDITIIDKEIINLKTVDKVG